MTIRQDQMGSDLAPAGGQPSAAAPAARNAAPAAAPSQKQSSGGPMSIAPSSEPSSRTKIAARTPAAQAAGSGYFVQVSAQKTEEDAKASYQVMQQKYPSVLGGREANIRRADIGQSGTWYRVQVGPFGSSEQANQLCSNLKDAGGQCIVQKN
jgi:cell division protein FtsN